MLEEAFKFMIGILLLTLIVGIPLIFGLAVIVQMWRWLF